MVTKTVIQNEKVRPPLPVLSPGILWKDFVFILGMGGIAGVDKDKKFTSKDISQQTVRAMERIAEVLDAENLSFKNVVRTRFVLAKAADFGTVNKIYRERTGEDSPACTYIQVNRCPIPGEDIKIQMIAHKGEKRLVQTDEAPALLSGYPQAIAAEDLFFIQGMNGVDVNTGRLISDDIAKQTERALENVAAVLAAGQLSLEDVVKATVFVTDLEEYDKVTEVCQRYINFLSPTFLEVPRISTKDEKVMVEVIASKEVKKRLNAAKAPALVRGMAQGVLSGDFIFVQGMGGIDTATGKVVSKDIVKQIEKALENINEVLKEGGMTLDDAVDASVFVTDIEQYPSINEIYGKYMGAQPPARICCEVSKLPHRCNIVIEMIAARES